MRRDHTPYWKKPHPPRYIHAKLGQNPRIIRGDMRKNPFLAKHSSTRNFANINEVGAPKILARIMTLRYTPAKFGADPCNSH